MAKNGKISFVNSVGGRIIISFLLVSIVSLSALAIIATVGITKAFRLSAENQLESVKNFQKREIEGFFKTLSNNMAVISQSSEVISSIERFIQYHNEMDISATGLYDMSSSKDGLTRTYKDIYDQANKLLKKYPELYGYYDVFLISPKHGHIMYSWGKGADLGENLNVGQYRDSGLAKAWKAVVTTNASRRIDISHYAPSDGEAAMFGAGPVRKDGEIIGVLAVKLSLGQINDIIQVRTGMGETGNSYLAGLNEDGTISLRSDRVVKEGKVLDEISGPLYNSVLNEGASGIQVRTGSTGEQELVSYAPLDIKWLNWGIFSVQDMAEINKPITNLGIQIAIASVIILMSITIVMIILSRGITAPLKAGVEFANTIVSKDLTKKVDEKLLKRKDEIGTLFVALSEMQTSLKGMMGEMNTGMSTLSAASTELLSISEDMAKGATMTTEKAGTVAAASEELNANATSVAAGMEQSSTNLDSVASATEEMTATITQIAQNTESARSITEKAVEQSKQVTELMDVLGESANEIGKVIEAITSISDQTNLLALNATIEAARAGAAGKGFAVVASEIKELAKQTADATEDIKNKIGGIQTSTNNSIVDIKKITEIIQNVNDYVTTIASAVEEQSITTKDISDNMGQASSAVQDASERTAQNSTVSQDIAKEIAEVSSSAEEMSAAGSHVSESAKELSGLSERLKAMVDTYKL